MILNNSIVRLSAISAIGIVLLNLAGCGPKGQDNSDIVANKVRTVKIVRPVVTNNEVVMTSENKEIKSSGDPVKDNLIALFDSSSDGKGESAIPKGTKINSISVADGLIIIDVSKEFDGINKSGLQASSNAMKAILKSLEEFPDIKKMRVTMDGKVFEDGYTGGWDNLPIHAPVADSGKTP